LGEGEEVEFEVVEALLEALLLLEFDEFEFSFTTFSFATTFVELDSSLVVLFVGLVGVVVVASFGCC